MGISACREAGHWEVAMALLHSAARNIELFGMLGDASKQSKGNNAAICCNLYENRKKIYIYIYVEMHMPLASALPFIVKMYDHLWLYGHKGP